MKSYSHSVFLLTFLVISILSCKTSQEAQISTTPQSDYETYMMQRNALLKADSLLYSSSNISLSTNEKIVNEKLRAIQRIQLDEYKNQHFFPPARNFYQSKKHIEENTLFKWLEMMPKGGALHIHTLAMGDPDWMIEKAMDTDEMYVLWDVDDINKKGKLRAFRSETVPQGYRSAEEVFSSSENYDLMRSFLTFDEEIDQDSVDIWNLFENIFNRIEGFVRYDPIMPEYLAHGFEILIEDHIQHVELRMPFDYNLYRIDDQSYDVSRLVDHFESALQKARQKDPQFTVKVISANLRFRSREYIKNDMIKQFRHKQEHPDWLAGYDLVAEEDAGQPTLFHIREFLMLDSLNSKSKNPLPLYLHNGESNWMNVTNLYDSYLLDVKRIGHGFNLFRFPGLLRKVKAKDICIEINPLSNQILGYIRDLRLHPGSTYLRNGLACTISSDDPFIFDYHGLSYDYWSVMMAWELDLKDLKMLSLNGLKYSALEDDEKEEAIRVWQNRWNLFIEKSLDYFK